MTWNKMGPPVPRGDKAKMGGPKTRRGRCQRYPPVRKPGKPATLGQPWGSEEKRARK